MLFLAHDFETTGVDPRTCGVVQSAIVIVDIDILGNWKVIETFSEKHHPGCLIPDAAANVHGIYDQDVQGLAGFEERLIEMYEGFFEKYDICGIIGYNSNSFDNVIARRVGLAEKGDLTEIDMMVAARRLMNDGVITRARLVDAYSQLVGKEPENAHDALADVMMTIELIEPVKAHKGFEGMPELVGWLEKPEANTSTKMPFGKYRGTPLAEVPKGYLNWLYNNGSLDNDLRAGVKAALNG